MLLLQCTQGVSRAALFCILWTLLERVEEEEVVDIYRTVRYARCSTPAAVANLVSGGAGRSGEEVDRTLELGELFLIANSDLCLIY